MKINSNGSTLDTNNKNSDSIEFGIGDVSTIIDILRNRLYANPIRTLTQEYLCNGRDSHRDAGNSDVPLKVTLPTRLEPNLKIRDYGTGLSPDRVKDVFVLYGSSTKRKDNVQTGGFGIGAKSAWAYTDSFIITSFYDGKSKTYIAHTGKNSNGMLELINETDSDEPNGVEVQIPVKESDIEQFVMAVYRCTYFWDVKPNLTGVTKLEIPASWLEKDKKVLHRKDNWFIVEKDDLIKRLFDAHNQDIYVLIDKIPYSINKFARECPEVLKLRDSVYAHSMNFIEVDNGVLEISATRESISDKEGSKEKVNEICKLAKQKLHSCIEDAFAEEFKDIPAYLKFYFSLKSTFNVDSIQKNFDFAFKKDGLSYKIVNGKITSTSFNGCIINKYSQKRQKSRSVLSVNNNVEINVGEEKTKFVLMNDTPEKPVPEYLFKEKIKKIFTDEADTVYVYTINNYTEEQRQKLKDHLGAVYVTDLPHDRMTQKQRRDVGKISLRYINRGTGRYGYRGRLEADSKVDVSLDEIASKDEQFISIPFSADAMYDFESQEFCENIEFLIKHGKFKVVKCSKRDYDALNTLDNVYEYSDVRGSIADYVAVEEKVIEDFVYRRASNSFEVLRNHAPRIKCPLINEYFAIKSLIPNQNNRAQSDIPDRILALYPHFDKINTNVKKLGDLENDINTKYPLMKQLNYIVGHYGNNDRTRDVNEFVFYLNAKHDSVKK